MHRGKKSKKLKRNKIQMMKETLPITMDQLQVKLSEILSEIFPLFANSYSYIVYLVRMESESDILNHF